MKVLKKPSKPEAIKLIVSDIDLTMYDGESGKSYISDGTLGEHAFLASFLGVNIDRAKEILNQKRKEIGINGKLSSISHAIYALGIPFEDWSRIRCECYFPENFLKPNPTLVKALEDSTIPIAAVTNSPREVGRRVLLTLGMSALLRSKKVIVFGPENFGLSKPDVRIFAEITKYYNLPKEACLSIGDHEYKDCQVAIEAGYGGAILIQSTAELIAVASRGGLYDAMVRQ